ncbi:MAG: MGMT family protein [Candidatus Omnitrophica bacterium]|nr:MGMT family protein [Candidatus Omnitrophota bacterium]
MEIGKNKNLTEFQKAVYKTVLQIPKGQTRTYKWVAEKIGKPKAYRAVGNALNKNPYIGRVPCHGVVRSDGNIGGYVKGGSEKVRLLEEERQIRFR